jgi:hypothetical protein
VVTLRAILNESKVKFSSPHQTASATLHSIMDELLHQVEQSSRQVDTEIFADQDIEDDMDDNDLTLFNRVQEEVDEATQEAISADTIKAYCRYYDPHF